MIPSKEEFIAVVDRISPHIHKTPIHTSRLLNARTQSSLYFKCDNFQKGGSYKLRGATNAILSLSNEKRALGVATHSSGNFAQALSLAASLCDVPAYIVMPENAPSVKVDAVRDYGGIITMCPSTLKDRESTLHEVIKKTGASPIHPSNQQEVIWGQGTMAFELLNQVKDLDTIVCPVGGGGVIAGCCIATQLFSPSTEVIGAEPLNADDAYWSLKKGEIVPSVNPDTIADGLRTQLGDQNFPIIKSHVKEIIRVSEEQIVSAMKLIWERMKIVVEPSSATSFAAVLCDIDAFKNKRVGLIITGGNVSLDNLPF